MTANPGKTYLCNMKKLLILIVLASLCLQASAFTKVIKEQSFSPQGIKSVIANSSGGSYTVSKNNNDSFFVRISLECKSFEDYNKFEQKYAVRLDNTAGSIMIKSDQIPASIGTVIYEIFLPAGGSGSLVEITAEKANISLKEAKAVFKINNAAGNLFADNISGELSINTEKMAIDINNAMLLCKINSKSSDVNYKAKSGSLNLMSTSGSIKIVCLGSVEMDIQTNSADISVLLPKSSDCTLQANSLKRPILFNFEEVELKGSLTPNSVKAKLGKGGGMIKLNTGSGDILISNVSVMSR